MDCVANCVETNIIAVKLDTAIIIERLFVRTACTGLGSFQST